MKQAKREYTELNSADEPARSSFGEVMRINQFGNSWYVKPDMFVPVPTWTVTAFIRHYLF